MAKITDKIREDLLSLGKHTEEEIDYFLGLFPSLAEVEEKAPPVLPPIIENTWHPDTCGCTLVYTYERDFPGVRTPVPEKSMLCQAHSGLNVMDGPTHYTTVLTENHLKNDLFAEAKKAIPAFIVVTVGDDGEPITRERLEHYHWAFDEQRVLHFDLSLGEVADKEAIADLFPGRCLIKDKDEVQIIKTLSQIMDKI